jgi:hypothetical protein
MFVRTLILALVVGLGWGLGGCKTVSPPAEGESGMTTAPDYSTGKAFQDFSARPAQVKSVVAEAMDDLGMTVVHRGRDGTVSQIDGRTPDQRTVTVTIRPNQQQTRVSCRIGWFGDEPLSMALLERVGIRLGSLPPAAISPRPPSSPASNPIFSRDAVPDEVMLRDLADAPFRDRVNP